MKNKKIPFIIIFSICLFGLSTTPIIHAQTDFKIGIEEGDALVWEYTFKDDSLVDTIIENADYSELIKDISVGDQYRFDITDISYDYDSNFRMNIYEVEMTYYEGKNLETNPGENIGDYYFHVGEDPEIVGQYFYEEDSAFILDVIAAPVDQYLMDFISGLPASRKLFFSINEGSTLIYDESSKGIALKEVYEYNQDGILQAWWVLWNNGLVFKCEYQGTFQVHSADASEDILFFAIIGAVIGIIALACIITNVKKRKKELNRQDIQKPTPLSPPRHFAEYPESEIKPKPIESEESHFKGFCPACGAKRDADATFCYECGYKF